MNCSLTWNSGTVIASSAIEEGQKRSCQAMIKLRYLHVGPHVVRPWGESKNRVLRTKNYILVHTALPNKGSDGHVPRKASVWPENVYSHESWVEIYFRDTPPPSDTECLVNSGYRVQIQGARLPFPVLKLYWFYCHQSDDTFFQANSVFWWPQSIFWRLWDHVHNFPHPTWSVVLVHFRFNYWLLSRTSSHRRNM